MLLLNSQVPDRLAFISSVVLLTISLIFCFRKGTSFYMRTLPYFCFLNVLSDYIVWLFPRTLEVSFLLYTTIELLYFSFLIICLIRSARIKRFIKILDAVYLLYVVYYLIRHGQIPPFRYPVIIESLILITASSIYFTEIISKPLILHLTAATEFWLVTGILFYFCMQIPILTLSSYYDGIGDRSLSIAIYSANGYTLFFTYILFIAAILCTRTKTYPRTY